MILFNIRQLGGTMISIVDLYKIIKGKYKLNFREAFIIYEENEEYIYFYSQEILNIQYVFKYIKKDMNVIKIATFNLKKDLKYDNFTLLSLNQGEILAYVLKDKDIDFYIYKNNKSKLLFSCEGDDLYYIDNRYLILEKLYESINSYSLLDLKENYIYKLGDFKNINISNLKVLNLNEKKYLALTKYNIDSYDLDYYFKYTEGFRLGDSGVYLFPLEKNIDNIKSRLNLEYKVLYENEINTYVAPVEYDLSYKKQKDINSYHYLVIKKDQVELYYIGENFNPVLETQVDLGQYQDIYRIFASDYPVKIEKVSDLYGFTEYRRFYPDKISVKKTNYRESLTYLTEDYLIYHGWEEPDNISYYEYTKLVDRTSGKDVLKIYGQARLLDNSRLLIYGKNFSRTQSYILQGGNRTYTDLRQILEAIEDELDDYNFLVTDFQTNFLEDKPEEFLLEKDYLFIKGRELYRIVKNYDIQWIWGVFTAIYKDLEEDHISRNFPKSNSEAYWKGDLAIEYPEGVFQIIAWDSSASLFVSDEDSISEKFLQSFPDALDLNYVIEIVDAQLSWIKEILLEHEKDLDENLADKKSKEIWYKNYKNQYLNPYIKIEYKDF